MEYLVKAKKLAKIHDCTVINSVIVEENQKITWKCPNGHEWEDTYGYVDTHFRCKKCSNEEKQQMKIQLAKQLASKHNCEVIDSVMENDKQKLVWKCEKGHEWKDTFQYMSTHFRCKECSKEEKSKARIEMAKILAEINEGKCLSEKLLSSTDKVLFECNEGHHWEATLYSVKKGCWCRVCSAKYKVIPFRKNKVTVETAKRIAAEKNGLCLSNEYINQYVKMQWRCEQGHTWGAAYNDIRNGHWCPDCRKLSIEDARELAKKKNGLCLSTEYINSISKLEWQCEFGHTWMASISSIKTKTWCPHCVGNAKKSIEEAHEIANKFGGQCLSSEYKGANGKLKWKCEKGHEWEATFSSASRGHWCRKCNSIRLKIEDFQALAQEKGGECLTDEYNPKEKMTWKCSKGHVWDSFGKNIKRGHWCPKCAKYIN